MRLPENPKKLVYFWVAVEKWFLGCKFSKDGTNTPDIDGCGVAWSPQQNLWSSVPEGHHLIKSDNVSTNIVNHFTFVNEAKL